MIFIPYGTRENTRRERFPFVTLLLVASNIAVFIWQVMLLMQYGDLALNAFIDRYAAVPANITDGSPLEPGIITAMFLHGSLLHIAGNMIYLMPFGDNVEDRMGHVRYLLFYLACGIIATLIFTVLNSDSNVPLIGASGAIAGVLGGYLRLHPGGYVKGFLFIIILLIPITLPALLFIGYWFAVQLMGGLASLGAEAVSSGTTIAFVAHIAGFVSGLILAPIFQLRKKPSVIES